MESASQARRAQHTFSGSVNGLSVMAAIVVDNAGTGVKWATQGGEQGRPNDWTSTWNKASSEIDFE